jgi:hypothetical protein
MREISEGRKQLSEISLHKATVGLMFLIALQELPHNPHILKHQRHFFLLPLFSQHCVQILHASVGLFVIFESEAAAGESEAELGVVDQLGQIVYWD